MGWLGEVLAAMTIADDIIYEVTRRSGLTEVELAALLFGRRSGYQQRVNSICRRLVEEGRIVRHGNGGRGDPYNYHLPPIKRRV
jgi:hypothetical protein